MRLKDKVVVITGAGSGIGRAMAGLFAAEGANIVAAEWHGNTLKEVVAEVGAAGGSITGVEGNVAVEADCNRIIDTAMQTYSRLDVLCNNAGVMDLNQGAGDLSNEIWERVIGINLNGPMYLTRRAVQIMLKQGGGSIVNTASVAGLGGGAAGAAYTVSKHGLIGLTRNTAFVYCKDGIRCNAIAAGAVETNIMQSLDASKLDPKATARYNTWYAAIPATLQGADIAKLALFLASDESKMINGAIIPADAGWSAA
ncbi:MAG: SDR family oxidoreductase [Gallionellaceae bacterium]|jgi:NAD(P)-dependent dehydrogenase (short-subunit alcohol dehydrogenase family)